MPALKFIVALVAAVAAAVAPLLTGGSLDLVGQINILVAAAGALHVYLAKNEVGGPWEYAKTWSHAIATVGVVVVSALSGGISTLEWLQVGSVVLGTLGVFAAPNRRAPLGNLIGG